MQTLPIAYRFLSRILFISVVFFLLLITPNVAFATETLTPQQSALKEYRQQGQLERIFVVQTFLRGILSELSCQLTGVQRTSAKQDCLATDPTTGKLRLLTQNEVREKDYKPGGLLVMTTNAIGFLYTKPTETASYVQKIAGNFGVTKKAYAQPAEVDCAKFPNASECVGIGFQALAQIQNLFELTRNIVFLLLVGVFVIVGLLIMVRFHMDPRTVMTIQNQIPKAIIAILLITFSYAIAGLLVDVMWVTTYFGINAVASTRESCNTDGTESPDREVPLGTAATRGILNNPIGFTTDIFGNATGCFGAFDGIAGLAWTVGQTFGGIASDAILGALPGVDAENRLDCGINTSGINFGACIQEAVYVVIQFIIGILAFLIIFIAILAALFRLWFALIKNYIMLLLDVILGPFYILLGLIPGSQLNFTRWLRGIIAQLAMFPAAAVLLVMASVIASDPKVNDPASGAFLPPLIGNPNIADNIGSIIAFGFILIAPGLLDQLREGLQSPVGKQGGLILGGVAGATGRTMGIGKGLGEQMAGRHAAEAKYDPGSPQGVKYVKQGVGWGPFRFRG